MNRAPITLYTTSACTYSRMTKRFLEQHGIPYVEYDVIGNDAARAAMVAKSSQVGVPVIEVDGEIFVGFDERELRRALDLA
ncbi:MAG: hypothetical protein A3A43_00155 [Candidatus Liptonbacteria bacterium RIFCSPLOWO2_01_FULL_56_20]|uniref:Glutaredoxin domain-containing protein n=1 Tax=Candidatus Liptonbacteria bacterium RIFCSPLOWO2_01_FULL_56_20 TaxID=1798652 RepID=A0A1G2CIP3_9BACT|nr:MAG: Glutaredoxin-like protein, YruB-family [Parcubacteria group bacterium GW2011_GWB1_56_8]OGY97713.1 MAG: hypothetical protein A2681_01575 [Candidatus Liptonbacteria bacterium RIFCSPHIGHO2_01_FULL_56_18b]OGZ01263.1 MAG: hypothetical protein A3A43_00155 [Candidatus Liptonbacteria bacterium RIFCSPLOWO2_01_FULL_56_20]